jgi:PCI domain
MLDMYISPHVNTLYSQIRNKALIQYFSPYMSADMRKMSESFNTTVPALEDELMQLILDGQIKARIDSHNKVGTSASLQSHISYPECSLGAFCQGRGPEVHHI